MKQLRVFSTALAAAVFLIVATTGLTLFFHVQTEAGKVLHEWLSWGLLTGVVLHVISNGAALRGYLRRTGVRVTLAVAVLVLGVAVSPLGGQRRNQNAATRGAVEALLRAPLRELAPLAGRDLASLVTALGQAGFAGATAESTCTTLAGPDRGRRAQALAVIFPAPAR